MGGLRWGVEPICRVLSEHGCLIAPSTYYAARAAEQRPSKRALRDEWLKVEITRVHAENYGVYGAPKVWIQLNREGIAVARCVVERLMRELGLTGARRCHGGLRRCLPGGDRRQWSRSPRLTPVVSPHRRGLRRLRQSPAFRRPDGPAASGRHPFPSGPLVRLPSVPLTISTWSGGALPHLVTDGAAENAPTQAPFRHTREFLHQCHGQLWDADGRQPSDRRSRAASGWRRPAPPSGTVTKHRVALRGTQAPWRGATIPGGPAAWRSGPPGRSVPRQPRPIPGESGSQRPAGAGAGRRGQQAGSPRRIGRRLGTAGSPRRAARSRDRSGAGHHPVQVDAETAQIQNQRTEFQMQDGGTTVCGGRPAHGGPPPVARLASPFSRSPSSTARPSRAILQPMQSVPDIQPGGDSTQTQADQVLPHHGCPPRSGPAATSTTKRTRISGVVSTSEDPRRLLPV
jgi:hypothetical protein